MRQKEKKTANQKQHQLYEKTRKDQRNYRFKKTEILGYLDGIHTKIYKIGCLRGVL